MSVSFARRANFTAQREGELFLSLSVCRRFSETNLHSFQAASLLKENESLREEVCLTGLLVFFETSLVIILLFMDKSCLKRKLLSQLPIGASKEVTPCPSYQNVSTHGNHNDVETELRIGFPGRGSHSVAV